jgi:hypothetical protein
VRWGSEHSILLDAAQDALAGVEAQALAKAPAGVAG